MLIKATALLLIGTGMIGVFAGVELFARRAGIMQVPLYRRDQSLGYIPVPDQNGIWRGRNAWAFNDRSMGTAVPFAPAAEDVFLLGDSIVFGGVHRSSDQTLGAQIEEGLKLRVWPLSAPSWALWNEVAAFRQIPGATVPSTLVLVLNSEDFQSPSRWRSEFTHPTHQPAFATIYLARKYIGGRMKSRLRQVFGRSAPPEAELEKRVAADGSVALLKSFVHDHPGRVVVVLYPRRSEIDQEPALFDMISQAIGARAEIVRPSHDHRWNSSLYEDRIHPNARGVTLLAALIAEQVRR